jgi:hypothetical protein
MEAVLASVASFDSRNPRRRSPSRCRWMNAPSGRFDLVQRDAGQDERVPLGAVVGAPERGRKLPRQPKRAVVVASHGSPGPQRNRSRVAVDRSHALEEVVVLRVVRMLGSSASRPVVAV